LNQVFQPQYIALGDGSIQAQLGAQDLALRRSQPGVAEVNVAEVPGLGIQENIDCGEKQEKGENVLENASD
jgi:hypothetical protein